MSVVAKVEFFDEKNELMQKGQKKLKGDNGGKWDTLIEYIRKRLSQENVADSYNIVFVNHNNRNDSIHDAKSFDGMI